MLAPFSASLAFATLLLAGPTASEAAATDAAPAQATKPTPCTYRDANYGINAVICVAPHFGQVCGDGGKWSDPTGDHNLKDACANAQIPVPGIPPPQCMYHDVKYAPNGIICVGPHFGQTCNIDGGWSAINGGKHPGGEIFNEVCANAQIPLPILPAPPK
jgi:hypothetical protein